MQPDPAPRAGPMGPTCFIHIRARTCKLAASWPCQAPNRMRHGAERRSRLRQSQASMVLGGGRAEAFDSLERASLAFPTSVSLSRIFLASACLDVVPRREWPGVDFGRVRKGGDSVSIRGRLVDMEVESKSIGGR